MQCNPLLFKRDSFLSPISSVDGWFESTFAGRQVRPMKFVDLFVPFQKPPGLFGNMSGVGGMVMPTVEVLLKLQIWLANTVPWKDRMFLFLWEPWSLLLSRAISWCLGSLSVVQMSTPSCDHMSSNKNSLARSLDLFLYSFAFTWSVVTWATWKLS